MSEINLKLKTYDELTFEISQLNIDKYLLEQKLQQKENIIKEVREYIETKYDYLLGDDTFLDHDERIDRKQIKHILEILDKGKE